MFADWIERVFASVPPDAWLPLHLLTALTVFTLIAWSRRHTRRFGE